MKQQFIIGLITISGMSIMYAIPPVSEDYGCIAGNYSSADRNTPQMSDLCPSQMTAHRGGKHTTHERVQQIVKQLSGTNLAALDATTPRNQSAPYMQCQSVAAATSSSSSTGAASSAPIGQATHPVMRKLSFEGQDQSHMPASSISAHSHTNQLITTVSSHISRRDSAKSTSPYKGVTNTMTRTLSAKTLAEVEAPTLKVIDEASSWVMIAQDSQPAQ